LLAEKWKLFPSPMVVLNICKTKKKTTMKKQIIRLIALLIFASVAMSSCSVEYREHHRHHWEDEHHEHHDHDDDDD